MKCGALKKTISAEGFSGITAIQETRDLLRGNSGIDVEWIDQVRFADPVAKFIVSRRCPQGSRRDCRAGDQSRYERTYLQSASWK